MTILKLQNEGDTFTGKVTSAGEVAGNFGPQVKFDFEGGETLYMPKDSADRQLSRIPLGYAECIGESLTFSRDPNTKPGAKPYWGIRVSDIVDRTRPTQPKRLPPPSKVLPFDEEAFPSAAHGESVADPYDHTGPIHPARVPEVPPPNDADVPEWVEPKPTPREVAPAAQKKAAIVKGYVDLFAWMKQHLPEGTDDAAVQSATATVWITWGQKGLQP